MSQLCNRELFSINGGGTIRGSMLGNATISAVLFIVNLMTRLFK